MKDRFVFAIRDPDDPKVSPQIADRLLTDAILTMLEQLVEQLAAEGWDEPPLLGLVYLRGRSPHGPQPLQGVYLEWVPLPIFALVSAQVERQHHALVWLAEEFQKEAPADFTPDDLVAIVIVNEAWYVMIENPDQGASEELLEAARQRKVHEREDRIEVKQMVAVDINGTVYLVNHQRDGATDHMAGPAMSPYAIAGDVPNGLEYLMLTFQQKTLPPFEDWWVAQRDYNRHD